jgi:hypothetical protein
MKRCDFFKAAFFSCLLYAAFAWSGSDDELKPWEKLGVSQTEWKMIVDNHISEAKVHELLAGGIGIGEYVAKPWKKIGLSEKKWIKKRRSGLSEYDVELEANPSKSDSSKADSTSREHPAK